MSHWHQDWWTCTSCMSCTTLTWKKYFLSEGSSSSECTSSTKLTSDSSTWLMVTCYGTHQLCEHAVLFSYFFFNIQSKLRITFLNDQLSFYILSSSPAMINLLRKTQFRSLEKINMERYQSVPFVTSQRAYFLELCVWAQAFWILVLALEVSNGLSLISG